MDKAFHLKKFIEKLDKGLKGGDIEMGRLKKEKLKIKDTILSKQKELKSLIDQSK